MKQSSFVRHVVARERPENGDGALVLLETDFITIAMEHWPHTRHYALVHEACPGCKRPGTEIATDDHIECFICRHRWHGRVWRSFRLKEAGLTQYEAFLEERIREAGADPLLATIVASQLISEIESFRVATAD